MSETRDPIRQQLIEARRNQILEAAIAVFAEKGFHRATTKDIAGRAGIAEGTIYNYFGSKDDLLIGVMARLTELEMLNGEFAEALQGDVREFFILMFQRRVQHMEKALDMLTAIMPEVLANPNLREHYQEQFVLRVATLIEEYVRTRVELGHIRPVDPALAARVMQAMFMGLLVWRIFGDEVLVDRWDELPDLLATIIFDGMRPRGGE
jgi:AcrR family transcriptional regulator